MPQRKKEFNPGYKAIAEYYDAEFAHLDYLSRDVPLLLSQMKRRGERVLELATGTARAAIPLAQAGHKVVGVDYDASILAIAKRKRDFVGLAERELGLVKADARTVRLPGGKGKFSWCVILFNSLMAFPTLDGLDQVLETSAWHLKRGGRFWADLYNPDWGLLAEGESYGLDPVTFYVPQLDRVVSRTTDLEDSGPQIRRVTFNYRWFLEGEEQQETVSFDLGWIMPRELTVLLERHGFEVEHFFGDYDESPYNLASPRIIVQAKKR